VYTPSVNLTHLNPGEQATIRAIEADEGLYHRLMALGFRIGKRIELVRRARFSGPLHVRIGTGLADGGTRTYASTEQRIPA
jgi:ferrous iron transport protein A